MFDLFNVPALDYAISKNKTIKFTHDPRNYKGALLDEYNYLLNNGYRFDPEKLIATPVK